MINFLGNPLNGKCTIYTRSDETDEFNQPTWTATVLQCAIFEGKEKQIQRAGQTINSYSQIAVKVPVSEKGMVYFFAACWLLYSKHAVRPFCAL